MKPLLSSLLRSVILVASLDSGTYAASAQNSVPPKAAVMVEIEAQFFHATDAQVRSALKMLPSPPSPGVSLSGLFLEGSETAIQLLSKSGADFFSSPRLITKSGQRATVEAVRELNYPTAFQANPKTGRVIPSAFEMRKVGVTVEIEPVVSANEELIDLAVVPSVVSFLGFIDYGIPAKEVKGSEAEDGITRSLEAPLTAGSVWQPIFSTSKVTTNVNFLSGQTFLLGGMMEYELPPAKAGEDVRKRHSVPSKRLTYVMITARIVRN